MQQLVVDPPVPFLVPDGRLSVTLAGAGGTGGFLAQALARLMVHIHDRGGAGFDLTLIDGDRVERKNIGRQLFAPADIGRNKALALAGRLNAAFGLQIRAIPEMLGSSIGVRSHHYSILVGCVDNAAARREIARRLSLGEARLWLDCGNTEWAGQVVVGNALSAQTLRGGLGLGTLATALPAPSMVYPNILQDEPPRPRADCAAAIEDGAQALMINQAVASLAAQYLYCILVERRLTRYRSTLDLRSMVMQSRAITAANIAADCGVSTETLLQPRARNVA